jgi:hypothetical protein
VKLSIKLFRAHARRRGWALLVVMSLAGCALMVLAGVMNWADQNSARTARNNEYFATSYAAEAATEKALSSLSQNYENYGFSLVSQNLSTYATMIPTSSDNSYWANYQFSGGTTANQIIVTNTAVASQIVMGAPYTGLTMMANTYEIIANAKNTSSEFGIVSTVGQQLYLGTIPLFQFAVFYQGDMEIAPGANMTISGPVHGNANIYMDPQDTLTFSNITTAVGTNYQHQSPLDPSSRTFGTVGGTFENGVDPLNLPVGTNTASGSNNSQSVYAILEPPTSGEGPNTAIGTNLLYNRADMIIIISNNNTISVTSGADINSQATVISNYGVFLSTNGSFYDQRDSLTVNPVVINVSNLVTWSQTNTTISAALATARGAANDNVESIYIDDQRSTSNASVTTNYTSVTNYSTNAASSTTYPTNYVGSVTNVLTGETNSTAPSGNYVGTITNIESPEVSSSSPSTYADAVTNEPTYSTNKHGVVTTVNSYHYSLITDYAYAAITGYTYSVLTPSTGTNTSYLTNWTTVSQPGIVLSNGSILPSGGLSIATPDPAYIIGNWNIMTNKTGSSDAGLNSTAYTYPSAIYADAITVLSPSWNPANSTASLSSRTASSDTVNAAFLTGNVPSNGSYYSGGVENFPRFLENWSGQTFTYNGSMVCMFSSQIATAPWPNTGTVYNPPTRNWAFDNNFSNPAKQPPMTPQVQTLQRSQWVLLKPYTTSF